MIVRLLFLLITVLGCGTSTPSSDPARTAAKPSSVDTAIGRDSAAPDPNLVAAASAFGTLPAYWGVDLSPSGDKVSALSMDVADAPIGNVITLSNGAVSPIVLDEATGSELRWCGWASEDRLLCGHRDVVPFATDQFRNPGVRTPNRIPQSLFYITRLIGVDADGRNMAPLPRRKIRKGLAQYQDQIVDWLYEDPTSVLLKVPDFSGSTVGRLDVGSGRLRTVTRSHDQARTWISDGHGRLRVRELMDPAGWTWQFLPEDGGAWKILRRGESRKESRSFTPQGFGDDLDLLYTVDRVDGRLVMQAIDLSGDGQPRIVFAHPDVDVLDSVRIGKEHRIIGVAYETDTLHTRYFESDLEQIREKVEALLPDQRVEISDESWDRRIYLIHASGELDPGSYYRFDSRSNELDRLLSTRPLLDGRRLAATKIIRFPDGAGRDVAAYLTLPIDPQASRPPAVLLPRGPHPRDDWGFDWLTQFLAARGYAVLEVDFEGSQGFSEDWTGEGGFAAWERVVADLEHGRRWLVDDGIIDPSRVCIAGWGHGGYAAMMSAIEHPSGYRCVASIAGVSALRQFMDERGIFLDARSFEEWVGNEREVLTRGSPIERADELKSPLLIIHGENDVDVSVRQSRSMAKVLRNEGKPVEWVEFGDAEHVFWTSRDRIELLERLGGFLDRHTASH